MVESILLKRLLIFMVLAIWPVYLLIKAETRRIRNNNAPEVSVKATVLTKTVTDENIQYTGWHMRDSKVLFATFLLEDGDTVTLYMTSKKYGTFKEGDTGQLLYQGTKLLEFKKDDN